MPEILLKKKSRTKKYFKKHFSKINIIKYGGGPLAINTFRIYTTGIADDGNTSSSSYGSEWDSFVRNRVLELIPTNYTNIEIYHHDILYNDESHEEKQKQIDFINRVVVQNDLLNRRVSVSVFLTTILNIKTNSPFIVFDYAHLFKYINPKLTSCNVNVIIDGKLLPSGSLCTPRKHKCFFEKSYNIENIKSVYLGYNESSSIRSNYIIKFTNVFTVNSIGSVNTYIDELFTRKLPIKIDETLIPDKVNLILLSAVKENIKKEIGSIKFNESFAKTQSLNWIKNIITSLDNKHIEFPTLIKNAYDMAIRKIRTNMDKNEDFWLTFK
jgi:hypothetical protein